MNNMVITPPPAPLLLPVHSRCVWPPEVRVARGGKEQPGYELMC